ncbi:MAG: signal peptide peptidase SppA, partial [Gemmatimonadota bacterium]
VEGTVGLVYAVGAITGGDSGFDPVFGRTLGARSTIEMLENVARDDALDAVVIRVDSPGGDALASEEIWAAIEEVKKHHPVIVSMGDVAGSGGYYIAAGAETIVAAPSTITGSIGVLGVIFNAAETWDKLGIRWDTVTTNPAAEFPTTIRPMTEAERGTFRDLIADIYRSFLERVAAGRGRSIPEIDAVAQGRIWSGTQASERGLVDEVGGLETALVAARRAAGLDPEARVALHIYPAEQTLMERLRELAMLQGVRSSPSRAAAGVRLAGGARISEPAAVAMVRELAALVTGFGAALRDAPGRPLTVMPFVPTIR